MKRSHSLFTVLAAAALSIAVVAYERTEDVFSRAYRAVREGIKLAFLRAVDVIATPKVETNVPEVRVVQAKAFQARIEKRERPVLTPGWRMCSSI